MAKGNYNADKEAAAYAARTKAEITNRASTWFYRDGDGDEYAVTAEPDANGGVTIKIKKGEF